MLDNLEGLQQPLPVHHPQLIRGRWVLGEVELREQVGDSVDFEQLSVGIIELGGQTLFWNVEIGNSKLHVISCRVRIDDRIQRNTRIVIYAHRLNLVGLLYAFQHGLVAVARALHGNLSDRIGNRAGSTRGSTAHWNEVALRGSNNYRQKQ